MVINMEKHTHNWQFVKIITVKSNTLGYYKLGEFICECGLTKHIKIIDND